VAALLRRDEQTSLDFVDIRIGRIELGGTLAKVRAKWLGRREIETPSHPVRPYSP
jgi:hypothetical protein